MKYWLIFLGLPLLAQYSDAEQALGRNLREETLRDAKPLAAPAVDRYLQELASKLNTGQRIELANLDAEDPMPLPGGLILIPANALLKANSETELATALAHAIGHLVLRHGIRSAQAGSPTIIFMGSLSGIHPDPRRPSTIPVGFRKYQAQYEQEAAKFATDLVSSKGLNQPNSQAFLIAKAEIEAALKAQEIAAPPAPSLVRKQLHSPRR